jgi:hypothetical protein
VSVHFISGKPGGGKSLYATKLVFEELRFGTRHVVTNLALKPGELNEYYHKHFADDSGFKRYNIPWFVPKISASFLFWYLPEALALKVFPLSPEQAEKRALVPQLDDISSRITLITDDDLPTFFTKRPGVKLDSISNEDWRLGKRPDYTIVKDAGVMFVLDEVHIAFNARAWALTGAEVLYYLSQHRKLGDDVLAITQSVANVDKQFRSVAQDFTYIRNLAKERFGHFRLPARFIRKTYAQPPVGDLSEPMEIGSFSLDVNGLAKCYDTAKGVGIHGRAGADTKERKKGIHWSWFVIGLPLALFAGMHYAPNFIAKLFFQAHIPPSHTTPAQTTNAVTLPSHDTGNAENQPAEITPNRMNLHRQNLMPEEDPVEMSGYCKVGNKFLVFLTDGNDYESGDGELMQLGKKFCIIGTNKFMLHVDDPRKHLRPDNENQNQPQQQFPGVVIPRSKPYVQIIPFGNRNKPTPLPAQNDEGLTGFDSQPSVR